MTGDGSQWWVGLSAGWDATLRMTAVLGLAWMLHLLLLRSNPRWRVLLWRGASVGLVAIPLLTVAMPRVQVSVSRPADLGGFVGDPETDGALSMSAVPDGQADVMADDPPDLGVVGTHTDPPHAAQPVEATGPPKRDHALASWVQRHGMAACIVCWAVGVCWLTARWLAAHVRVRRSVAASMRAPGRCQRLLEDVAEELGCRRRVALRCSANPDVPFLAGLRRPVIVLPQRMTESDGANELPAILAHDLSHLTSRDLVWMGLLQWVTILLWPHPFVWRIGRAHAVACEEVCDGAAAAHIGDVTGYSRTLARVALAVVGRPHAAAAIAMARSPEIMTRLARLKRGLSFSRPARRWVALSVALGTVALSALGAFELVYAEADGETDPARRTIRFPADRSVGKLSLARQDEPSWYRSHHRPVYWGNWGWDYLCEAKGSVTVPAGAKVKLTLHADGASDLSWVTELGADDLYALTTDPAGRSGGSKFGDADLRRLSALTGLKELVLIDVRLSDRGLRAIEALSSLKLLWLRSAQVGDAGLAHLAKLKSLETLSLHTERLSDAGLAHLSKLASLKQLNLTIANVRGPGLEHLAKLPSLRYLSAGPKGFGDIHLAHLKDATSLRGLRLLATSVTDEGLVHLSKLTGLEYLDLGRTQVTDAGLVHLKPLRSLKRLNIRRPPRDRSNRPFTAKGMALLSEMQSLQHLDLPNIGMTDACLAHVAKLENLKYLWVGCWSSSPISDAGLKHVAKLRGLEQLKIGGTGITDKGVRHIAGLANLKELNLAYAPGLTNDGLAHLGRLKSLQTLQLPGDSDVTLSGLAHLNSLMSLGLLDAMFIEPPAFGEEAMNIAGLTRLEWLGLPAVRDQDLACLAGLRRLRWLSVSGTKMSISDAGMANLTGLRSMEHLQIGGDGITDEGLACLANMKKLKFLQIKGDFTDEGMHHLEGLKALGNLRIYSGTWVSSKAMGRLRKRLPALRMFNVDRQRGTGRRDME